MAVYRSKYIVALAVDGAIHTYKLQWTTIFHNVFAITSPIVVVVTAVGTRE